MYERVPMSGLGFSLTPPKWLRETAQQIVGGVKLTVPTPIGPVALTPSQAAAAARGATVTYTPPGTQPPSIAEQVERNVPGGWATLAIGAGLLAFLLLRRR